MRSFFKEHGIRFTKFAMVGVVNTVVDFGVFAGLIYGFDLPLLLANSAAYSLAVLNSFFMNRYWTFRDRHGEQSTWVQAALFFGLNLVGLALGNLTIWLAAGIVPVLLAKLLSIGVTVLWNYMSSARVVYRPAATGGDPRDR